MRFDLAAGNAVGGGQVQQALLRLSRAEGRAVDLLPEVAVLRIDDSAAKPAYVTLFKNVGRVSAAREPVMSREAGPSDFSPAAVS